MRLYSLQLIAQKPAILMRSYQNALQVMGSTVRGISGRLDEDCHH